MCRPNPSHVPFWRGEQCDTLEHISVSLISGADIEGSKKWVLLLCSLCWLCVVCCVCCMCVFCGVCGVVCGVWCVSWFVVNVVVRTFKRRVYVNKRWELVRASPRRPTTVGHRGVPQSPLRAGTQRPNGRSQKSTVKNCPNFASKRHMKSSMRSTSGSKFAFTQKKIREIIPTASN